MGSGLPFTVVGYPSLSNPCQEENAMAEMRKKLDRVSNSAIIGMAVRDGGWGAQVLEHPICGITIFADVDITEREREIDFAHEEMNDHKDVGTVGLWVSLHGESVLQGGMHHLAALVDFPQAEAGLLDHGVLRMKPFSA